MTEQVPAPAEIEAAARVLGEGGLVAFPTETVYGLGADASNPEAVARIYEVKGRPPGHPLIVHIADASGLDRFAEGDLDRAKLLADAFWPGPLTVIVAKRPGVIADEVTGNRATVGLRVPDHPVALQLLGAFGQIGSGAVAAPSANRFGGVSPTSAAHVTDDFASAVDVVLDGGFCRVGVESTIIDLSGPEPTLLRPGGIAIVELEAVLGVAVADGTSGTSRAPGMMVSHYAPDAKVKVVTADNLQERLDDGLESDVGVVAPVGVAHQPSWHLPADAAGYAAGLYSTFRHADKANVRRLLVVPPGSGQLLEAVLDRLKKAAGDPAS